MSFQQNISGVNASSTMLDVIGNNIANSNTVGFKKSRAEFGDLYASTLASALVSVGMGAKTQRIAQQFIQGSNQQTNNPFDLAIIGNGFFRMMDENGKYTYTRNGQFQLDRNGYMVNGSDMLIGMPANEEGVLLNGAAPSALQVLVTEMAARATGGSGQPDAGLHMGINLDSSSKLIPQGTSAVNIDGLVLPNSASTKPAPPKAGDAVSYQTQTVDPMGGLHILNIKLTYLGSAAGHDSWSVATQLDGQGYNIQPDPLIFQAAPNPSVLKGGTQQITFKLNSPPPAYSGNETNFNFTLELGNVQSTVDEAVLPPAQGKLNVSGQNNLTVPQPVQMDVFNSNLNAQSPPGTNHSYYTSFIDPNGRSHTVHIELTRAPLPALNTWNTTYSVDGQEAKAGSPVLFDQTTGNPITGMKTDIKFDYPALERPGEGGGMTITMPPGTMDLRLNFSGMTQTSSTFTQGRTETRQVPLVDVHTPSTYSWSMSSEIYDSQGAQHNLQFFLTQVGLNSWVMQTSFDGGKPEVQPGYLTFDANGKMVGNALWHYSTMVPSPSGSLQPLSFNIFLDNSTQFGNRFAIDSKVQDGYASGTLSNLEIDQGGIVRASYSNNQSRSIGQVMLYQFNNPQGLRSIGDNRWEQTFNSGDPRPGTAKTSNFGKIESGFLEGSNVELTQELVNMIIAQRSFQANSTGIRTQSEILQTIIQIA